MIPMLKCLHGMSMYMCCQMTELLLAMGVQTWEALPPKTQGGFKVGATRDCLF